MTKEKLAKAREIIDDYRHRAADLKTDDIIALARVLERFRRPGGIHLMYGSPLASRRVLAITGHPSRPIGKGLALKMIGILEEDADAWEEGFARQDAEHKGKTGGNGHG
jgi:hypothetical protein